MSDILAHDSTVGNSIPGSTAGAGHPPGMTQLTQADLVDSAEAQRVKMGFGCLGPGAASVGGSLDAGNEPGVICTYNKN
jgi:hypothetical protein